MTIHYHESPDALSTQTREIHRAIATVVEEWEAVDWYQQRMDLTGDAELRAILEHNRDEEIEHAMMALEWLRRNVPAVDQMMGEFLFTKARIVDIEEGDNGEGEGAGNDARGDLGIGGNLR
jgi:uncharacterized protein